MKAKTRSCRIFFATDIHGSTRCFRKFINAGAHYDAQVLILGGDVTGKSIRPIVRSTDGTYVARDGDRDIVLRTADEIATYRASVADAGAYSWIGDEDELQQLHADEGRLQSTLDQLAVERMRSWAELADERLLESTTRVFFNAGNDDVIEIDAVIDSSQVLIRPEGRCFEVSDGVTMISLGYANLTPFGCPRDISEEELRLRIKEMVSHVPDLSCCIFNFHCPPRGSGLDTAIALDRNLRPKLSATGQEYSPVGSTAVREAIEGYQPFLGLHGHIHESPGTCRLGRTLCVNPGSVYYEGSLKGVLIDLKGATIRRHTFVCG